MCLYVYVFYIYILYILYVYIYKYMVNCFLSIDALLLVILYSSQASVANGSKSSNRFVKGMQIQGNMVLKVTLVTGTAGIWVWRIQIINLGGFYFGPRTLGQILILTNIFFKWVGENHQLEID